MTISRWAVLCGAGVSVAPPSAVPSWWGFNQAVLEALRATFLESHAAPVRAQKALDRLSLDALDVAEFSQIVSDAFAGATWFDLLAALDGTHPNENHRAIAAWAHNGQLDRIVTTNFDSLIERALEERGVDFTVCDALLDPTPDVATTRVVVAKLHGSAKRAASLIDLASQKHRGLPSAWRQWLGQTFAARHVAVAGFSGADLALGEDYLSLQVAASGLAEIRWLTRPGQVVLPEARQIISLAGERGRVVEGDLPASWPALGAPDHWGTSSPRRGGVAKNDDDAPVDVATTIAAWLEHPMIDADTCGIALSRLLDAARLPSAAQALRTSIITRARRRLRHGVNMSSAIRIALQLGQLAGDEPSERADSALYSLDLSNRTLRAVLVHMIFDDDYDQVGIRDEAAHDFATNHSNIARIELRRGEVGRAITANTEVRTYAQDLTGTRRLNHDAGFLEVQGAVAWKRRDVKAAACFWDQAQTLSRAAGHVRRIRGTTQNLERLGLVHNDGAARRPAP